MIHIINEEREQGEVALGESTTSNNTNQEDSVEDLPNRVNQIDPINNQNCDNSTNQNLLNKNLKTIQVRSINVNGLSDLTKLWKAFHYYVATKTDILCIQESRKLASLTKAPRIAREMIY